LLEELISHFKLKNSGGAPHRMGSPRKAPKEQLVISEMIDYDSGGFGKY
jgi:hypothetical protein